MGEAKRRNLSTTFYAEASGGTETAVYTAARNDRDSLSRMLLAAMAGKRRVASMMTPACKQEH